MLFTFSNNIKISSHGLINNLISNASHTIIFHIIQTFMLTHQLACINISFSNTHFKPFNSTTTVLSFSHHSCSSCQAKRRASLSKNPTLFSLLLSICSSHRPSPPPPPQTGWSTWVKRIVLSCHMSTFHWLIGLLLSSYPPTLDFHPIRRCHMSTWAPLGSPCLTNSAHDTWHLLSHSKCVKCPALPSLLRKTGNFDYLGIRRNSTW